MLDHRQLIESINNRCKSYFQNSYFNLFLSSNTRNSFFYQIQGTSLAINQKKNNPEEVKVLQWFDDFWIFIEFRFISDTSFISMSIFQGNETDPVKHQLFRAEWDDYNNPDEKHPQPHWHITSDFSIEESFKDFSDSYDEGASFSTFEAVKSEIIDIKKIHFAMNGNWQNDNNHTHCLNDNDKIVKWFQGMLLHLRTELEYVKQ